MTALSYVASEWHQTVGQLFNPTLTEELKTFIRAATAKKLTYMNDVLLKDKKFITGENISVADFYLYVTLGWCGYHAVDLSVYPVVAAYFTALGEHNHVKSAQEVMATNPTSTN